MLQSSDASVAQSTLPSEITPVHAALQHVHSFHQRLSRPYSIIDTRTVTDAEMWYGADHLPFSPSEVDVDKANQASCMHASLFCLQSDFGQQLLALFVALEDAHVVVMISKTR